MRLTPIKSNMTEVTIGDKTILFSYGTPVAYCSWDGYYKTNRKWSNTTSKHINQWLNSYGATKEDAREINQSELDNLVK